MLAEHELLSSNACKFGGRAPTPLVTGRAVLLSQPRFRSMWERYCRGVQAIVYVVDSADVEVRRCAPPLLTPPPHHHHHRRGAPVRPTTVPTTVFRKTS